MDKQTKRRLIIDRISWLRQYPATDFTNAWVSDLYDAMDKQTKRRLIIDRISWLRQYPATDFTNAWVSDLYDELDAIDKGN